MATFFFLAMATSHLRVSARVSVLNLHSASKMPAALVIRSAKRRAAGAYETSDVRAPVPTVAPVPAAVPLTFNRLPLPWSCIAFRESTDNLSAINADSGDEGAFQFAQSTWAEFAPTGYPDRPIYATLAQQYTVALRLWQARGYSPWVTAPLCGV